MKSVVSIQVTVDPEDLAEDLLHAGGFDIKKFILHLDEQIADEGFTVDLISTLVESLAQENSTHLEYLAGKALEQNFADETANTRRPNWPGPSHPMYMRDYAKEWDEAEKRKETFKQIKKLLGSLVE